MEKLSKELEAAIRAMPEPEKDKILLRLIRKDRLLIKKLQFELLSDEIKMKENREELISSIKHMSKVGYSHTPGLLMMDMRDFSGSINEHVKVTKDKYDEVVLNLVLVNEFFKNNYERVLVGKERRADSFARYVCKKADTVLKKLSKMHEDYHLEFEEDVNEMLKLIYQYSPTKTEAEAMNLPKKL
ncbi:MAG: hypothetical protein AAGI07_00930 [Bacteroidota bacterium]